MNEHRDRDGCTRDETLQLLNRIDRKLDLILKGDSTIMADLDTLNSLIDGLSTDFDALETELTTAQQAAQNNQPVDLSGAIAKLQGLKDKADAATQAINAPAPTPQPIETDPSVPDPSPDPAAQPAS